MDKYEETVEKIKTVIAACNDRNLVHETNDYVLKSDIDSIFRSSGIEYNGRYTSEVSHYVLKNGLNVYKVTIGEKEASWLFAARPLYKVKGYDVERSKDNCFLQYSLPGISTAIQPLSILNRTLQVQPNILSICESVNDSQGFAEVLRTTKDSNLGETSIIGDDELMIEQNKTVWHNEKSSELSEFRDKNDVFGFIKKLSECPSVYEGNEEKMQSIVATISKVNELSKSRTNDSNENKQNLVSKLKGLLRKNKELDELANTKESGRRHG